MIILWFGDGFTVLFLIMEFYSFLFVIDVWIIIISWLVFEYEIAANPDGALPCTDWRWIHYGVFWTHRETPFAFEMLCNKCRYYMHSFVCWLFSSEKEKISFELQLNQNEMNAVWVEVEVEVHEKNWTDGKTNISSLREHKFSNALEYKRLWQVTVQTYECCDVNYAISIFRRLCVGRRNIEMKREYCLVLEFTLNTTFFRFLSILQRLLLIAFAVIAAVAADVSHVLNPEGYHYEPPRRKLCEDGVVRESCESGSEDRIEIECPPPQVGRYPNCSLPPCPPGFIGQYPNCQKPRCEQG